MKDVAAMLSLIALRFFMIGKRDKAWLTPVKVHFADDAVFPSEGWRGAAFHNL